MTDQYVKYYIDIANSKILQNDASPFVSGWITSKPFEDWVTPIWVCKEKCVGWNNTTISQQPDTEQIHIRAGKLGAFSFEEPHPNYGKRNPVFDL